MRILRMRRVQSTASAVAAIAVMAATASSACIQATTKAEYKTPDGVYAVRLSARRAGLFGLDNEWVAELMRNGVSVTAPLLVYRASSFKDEGFESRFGTPKWVDARTLRFPSPDDRSGEPFDRVDVRNHSGRKVALLRVLAADLFLVIDLEDGDFARLNASRQAAYTNLSWLEGSGVWENGDLVRTSGLNFRLPRERTRPVEYRIAIESHGLRISESDARVTPYP